MMAPFPGVADALCNTKFAIFVTQYGPAAWPETDPTAGPPVIVLSVPKSGTYFTEALFRRMGYTPIYVHALDERCDDWRFPEFKGTKHVPITILSRLVLPGQIIVSHCSRRPDIAAALGRFKKIYLYRDLREVFVSHARADAAAAIPAGELAARVAAFCRGSGAGLKSMIAAASTWRNDPDVLAIDFADLVSTQPERLEFMAARLERFMGWSRQPVVEALRAVPGDETPTRSEGDRSAVPGAWNDECEAWFAAHMSGVEVVPDRVLSGREPVSAGSGREPDAV